MGRQSRYCGISRYNEILVWMRSFAKFIKFLRRLEMKFVSSMLSIKFHYKILKFSKTVF